MLIPRIIDVFELLVPIYNTVSEDYEISKGNVALCIITEHGEIYGKQFGDSKIKKRYFFNLAFQKASQAQITNTPTGNFETQVFNTVINEKEYGLKRHELIGWKGGVPITIENTKLYIGFSGYRENQDEAIIKEAVSKLNT